MAILTLGGSNGQWQGDAQNNGKVALYDASGRAINYVATGEYIAPVEVRQTSTAAAGQTVWNLRGPTALKAYIKRLFLTVVFDGTAAAATTLRYGVYRGSGAASPTGGTALTPEKKLSTFATSTTSDVRQDTTGVGLTTTSIAYDAIPCSVLAIPVSVTSTAQTYDLRFDTPEQLDAPVVIAANEHIAIRLQTVAAVIGLGIFGHVEWVER